MTGDRSDGDFELVPFETIACGKASIEAFECELVALPSSDGDAMIAAIVTAIEGLPDAARTANRQAILQASIATLVDRKADDVITRAAAVSELHRLLGFPKPAINQAFKTAIAAPKRKAFAGEGKGLPEAALAGRVMRAREIEPWPDPVKDGAALLDEIVGQLDRFLVAPTSRKQAAVLWAAFCHTMPDAFATNPKLLITAPTKRSGKTRMIELLQHLVPRCFAWSNTTAATFFRSLESTPTVLLDEGDQFIKSEPDLLGALNSGWRRSQATFPRCVGNDNEVRLFTTWAPVALAMISKPPDTLLDRSIVVDLRRRKPTEQIERYQPHKRECTRDLDRLGRQLARWVADTLPAMLEWEGEAPKALHDRAADNWEPLLAVAYAAGGHWPKTAREIAVELTRAEDDGADVDALLLSDIRALIRQQGNPDHIPTSDIIEHLNGLPERPWGEWSKGKGMTPHSLSRRLKPFELNSHQKKISGQNIRCYDRRFLEDVFERYLDPESKQGTNAPEMLFPPRHPIQSATPLPSAENSQKLDDQSATTVAIGNGNFSQKSGKGSEVATETASAGQKEIRVASYSDPAPAADAGELPEFLDRRRVVTRI